MPDVRDDGLYECETCGRTYDSELALLFCCDRRYEGRDCD